jgi:hypothetical protein
MARVRRPLQQKGRCDPEQAVAETDQRQDVVPV